MGIIRLPKGNFTTIENSIFKDDRISLKAKGLFCYMLSKKDGWSFSSERIALDNNDGRESVRSGLRELESTGYLKRLKINDGKGQFEVEYHLFYPDTSLTNVGKPDDGKPVVGKPVVNSNTNNSKTNISKEEYNKESMSGDATTVVSSSSNLSDAKMTENVSYFISQFNKIMAIKGKEREFKANDDVKNKLKKAIKQGYTFEDIKTALQNLKKDEYHVKTGFKYATPEFILRLEKLERFKNLTPVLENKPLIV